MYSAFPDVRKYPGNVAPPFPELRQMPGQRFPRVFNAIRSGAERRTPSSNSALALGQQLRCGFPDVRVAVGDEGLQRGDGPHILEFTQ